MGNILTCPEGFVLHPQLPPAFSAQLFELVAAVDRYPEFLPWCRAVRIRSSEKLKGTPDRAVIVADLVIGFRMIRERYTSRVNLQPPRRIDVTSVEGPFRHLDSKWTFEPVAPSAEHPRGGTMLTFRIRFELRSKLLQSRLGMLFNDAAQRTVAAFESRAKQLYRVRHRAAMRPAAHSVALLG